MADYLILLLYQTLLTILSYFALADMFANIKTSVKSPKSIIGYDPIILPNCDIVQDLDHLFSNHARKNLPTHHFEKYIFLDDSFSNEPSFYDDFEHINVEADLKYPAKRCLLPQFESVNLTDNPSNQPSHLINQDEMDDLLEMEDFITGHDLESTTNLPNTISWEDDLLDIIANEVTNGELGEFQHTLSTRRCLLPEFDTLMDPCDEYYDSSEYSSVYCDSEYQDLEDDNGIFLENDFINHHQIPLVVKDCRYDISNILFEMRI